MHHSENNSKTDLAIYFYIGLCSFIWTFCMSWNMNLFSLDSFCADQQIYSVIGQGILNGKQIYSDLWDHKGPLIFIFYALGYLLTPDSKLGLLLLSFVIQFISLFSAYKIATIFLSRNMSLLIPIIAPTFIFGSGFIYPSDIVLCLQLVTIYIFLTRKTSSSNSSARLFLFGLFSWIAIFLKLNLAPFWIPFLICETIETYTGKGLGACVKGLFYYTLSFFIILLTIIPFTNLANLWDSYILFNLDYASDGRSILLTLPNYFIQNFLQPWYMSILFHAIGIPKLIIMMIGILSFILFAFLWPRKTSDKATYFCLLTSALTSLLSIFAGSTFLFFYFVNLLPFYLLSWILLLKKSHLILQASHISISNRHKIKIASFIVLSTSLLAFAYINVQRSLPYAKESKDLIVRVKKTINDEKDVLCLGMIGIYPALNITPPISHFHQPLISTKKFNRHREETLEIIKSRGVKSIISQYPADEELLTYLTTAGYHQIQNTNNLYYYIRK